MPDVTIGGASFLIHFDTYQAYSYAEQLALFTGQYLTVGSMTTVDQSGAAAVATTPNTAQFGAAVFMVDTSGVVEIPAIDNTVLVAADGPVSITGGSAGETVIAGSGGLTYLNITPQNGTNNSIGNPGLIDYIEAGDGNNNIQSSTADPGFYQINLGAGDDTIAVFGSGVLNAGSGSNQVSVSGIGSYIYSEGFDMISGSTVMGATGTDTVNVGSGQATINPGMDNFLVNAQNQPYQHALLLNAGAGSDTVNLGIGGGTVTGGAAGNNILIAGAGGGTNQAAFLHGTANGDQLYATNYAPTTAMAGAGNETLSGAGGVVNGATIAASNSNNSFTAGSGNDTLLAGLGYDTLQGGTGTALMVSGAYQPTDFSFQSGKVSQDTITGFKPGDVLDLHGYTAAPTVTQTSGGTVLGLSDGTKLTFSDLGKLDPSQIKLS